VQEENLRDLAADGAPGHFLEKREHFVDVTQVVIGNPLGRSTVTAPERACVLRRVDEFVVVDRDRRDGVAMTNEKCFKGATRFEIGANVEERMPEEPRSPSALFQERPRDCLTAEHVGLELIERHRVEIAMRVGVITELEPGIEPHSQQPDPPFHIIGGRGRSEKPALVDEADRRDVVLSYGSQEPPREVLEACCVGGDRPGGRRREIVESDRNGPFDRASVRDRGSQDEGGERQRRGQPMELSQRWSLCHRMRTSGGRRL